jgi:hypothetical protein
VGPDNARHHYRPTIQGFEFACREKGYLAEGTPSPLSFRTRSDAGLWQYTEGLKAKEQEEREARLAKIRPAIRNMLKGNPNVFHYSTFPTADKLFAQHPIWQQARIESERKLIFEEYVAELKQREVVCLILLFRSSF